MENFKPFPGFGTLATHEGQDPEKWLSRAVVPPISMSTTFKQKAPGEHHVSNWDILGGSKDFNFIVYVTNSIF